MPSAGDIVAPDLGGAISERGVRDVHEQRSNLADLLAGWARCAGMQWTPTQVRRRCQLAQGRLVRISHPTTPARPGPPASRPARSAPPPAPPRWRGWLLVMLAAVGLLLLFHSGSKNAPTRDLDYTSFVKDVTADKVSTATITSAGSVAGTLRDGTAYTSQIPTALTTHPCHRCCVPTTCKSRAPFLPPVPWGASSA